MRYLIPLLLLLSCVTPKIKEAPIPIYKSTPVGHYSPETEFKVLKRQGLEAVGIAVVYVNNETGEMFYQLDHKGMSVCDLELAYLGFFEFDCVETKK